MWTHQKLMDAAVVIGTLIAVVIVASSLMLGCGGEGGDGQLTDEELEAFGIPTGGDDCSSGDVTVTGGEGPIQVNSGNNCTSVNEPEEEEDGEPVPEGTVPPFLGP